MPSQLDSALGSLCCCCYCVPRVCDAPTARRLRPPAPPSLAGASTRVVTRLCARCAVSPADGLLHGCHKGTHCPHATPRASLASLPAPFRRCPLVWVRAVAWLGTDASPFAQATLALISYSIISCSIVMFNKVRGRGACVARGWNSDRWSSASERVSSVGVRGDAVGRGLGTPTFARIVQC